MKTKILSIISMLLLMTISDINAQIDNLTNLSPEWIRVAARNAGTDGTDAVVYNPAGAVKLEDGFHIAIGNQSLFRKPSHEYDLGFGTQKHTQDGVDALLPSLYMSYNKNNWAVTGGVFVSGGGATANYSSGSINTDMIGFGALMSASGLYTRAGDQFMEGSSYYLTTMLGTSYEVSEMFSVGANIRYVTAKNTAKAGVTLTDSPFDLPDVPLAYEAEEDATGLGASIGIFFTPNEQLAISARYDMNVALEFTTDLKTDDIGISTDGEKNNRDLPAVLATGISYKWNDRFTTLADFNYYFQTGADWGTTEIAGTMEENSEMAGNAASYAIGIEYGITDYLIYSLGTVYSNFAFENQDGYYTNFGAFETVPANNTSINTGFKFQLNPRIAINAGYAHTMWQKDQNVKALNLAPADVDVTTNNRMSTVAFGVDIRL